MTWKPTLFSELAEFRNGLNFVKNDNGRTIKIIGVSDFKDYIELESLDTLEQITIKGNLKSEDLLQDDDLLFVRSNGNKKLIGRCMIIKVGNQEISYSGFTIRARLKSKEVLPRFLVQLFRSAYIKDQIQTVGGGTNISNLSQSILGDLKIPLPPLLEQCRIAEMLGVWDESIDLLERLIGKTRSRKQGLMQQLLTGKKRFKEFEGSEWKISRIGSFVKVQGGFAFKSENFSDSGIHVIRISNIQSCAVDLTSTLFHQFDPKLAQYQINHGDILIAMSGATTGKVGRYQEHHQSYLNQRVGRFTALDKTKISMDFVFQIVRSNKFQHLIMIDAIGGAQPNISSLDIENIVLKFPSLPEQEKIAAVLSAADEEILTLEKQLAAYKQQKLGLMQQLLTGKIRVGMI